MNLGHLRPDFESGGRSQFPAAFLLMAFSFQHMFTHVRSSIDDILHKCFFHLLNCVSNGIHITREPSFRWPFVTETMTSFLDVELHCMQLNVESEYSSYDIVIVVTICLSALMKNVSEDERKHGYEHESRRIDKKGI
jgi:hypothetical protein